MTYFSPAPHVQLNGNTDAHMKTVGWYLNESGATPSTCIVVYDDEKYINNVASKT